MIRMRPNSSASAEIVMVLGIVALCQPWSRVPAPLRLTDHHRSACIGFMFTG